MAAAIQTKPLTHDLPCLSPRPVPTSTTTMTTTTTAPTASTTIPETEHIFKSRLPPIPINNTLPLHSYLFQNLPNHQDRPCLIFADSTYSYAETYLLCQKTAAGLSNLGVQKGDVVMLLLQNCPEFIFSFFGAAMVGAISTPANPFYTPCEIFKQLKLSNSKLIITQSQFIPKLQSHPEFKLGEDFRVITIDNDSPESCINFSDLTNSNQLDIPEIDINPDDPVALPFSSGTTGLPKGVVLTHRSLSTSVSQQVDGENPNLYLKTEDVLLCVLPLFHIFSLNSVLMIALRRGCGILIMSKFEITAMAKLVEKHRVSVAMVVPPLVLALAKNPKAAEYDLSSIRLVMCGAAPLGKELEDELRARIPQAVLGQGYGMTEAGPVLSMCPGFAKEPLPYKAGSCGIVVRNAEMKVIDPDSGASLGYNEPGEICIRGQQIMKGYLNNPEATRATVDAEGWLHTGDIGYVDDDDEVFIVDRVKEIIKYKGFQVAPAELESILINHPSIVDAAVISEKDEAAGEIPVAFVIRSKDAELTEEEVKQYVASKVVFYKKLHKVYFAQTIPKSPSGKILRKELKARIPSKTPSPLAQS